METGKKENLYKIYIGFSSSKNKWLPFGAAIRAVLGTPYSHSYLRFKSDDFPKELIFQASGLAVNFMSYETFLGHAEVYAEFEIEVNDKQWDELMGEFVNGLGSHYDFWIILNTFMYKVFNVRPFTKLIKGWDCSKLMKFVLESLGYKISAEMDVVTPKDVYEYMISSGVKKV